VSKSLRIALRVLIGAAAGAGALVGFRRWSESRKVSASTPLLEAGRPDEWRRFSRRVPGFVEEIPNLYSLARAVFERGMPPTKDDLVIEGLGLLAWEDFEEIVTLAANGHGFGALKLLRGMFERIATVSYLQKHTDEIEAFCAYEPVRSFKIVSDARESFGAAAVGEDFYNEQKQARDEVRGRFVQDCCDSSGCNKKRVMISWTKKSILDVAKGADLNLRQQAFMLYYFGMLEAHPTFTSIANRMTETSAGFSFLGREQKAREQAVLTVALAHSLVLFNFGIQIVHFKGLAGVQPKLDRAQQRLLQIWERGTSEDDNHAS
jgi:hypothetical protein